MLRITRIVAERTAILVIADCAGQRVISDQVYFVESTLTEANVHAVVTRTPARGFVANAAQHRHAGGANAASSGRKNPPGSPVRLVVVMLLGSTEDLDRG